MGPGKARDAGKGVPLAKFRNAVWGHLPRNPSGRVSFCAGRRLSSFICNKQTSFLIPCPTQKLIPARVRLKREQTLGLIQGDGRGAMGDDDGDDVIGEVGLIASVYMDGLGGIGGGA